MFVDRFVPPSGSCHHQSILRVDIVDCPQVPHCLKLVSRKHQHLLHVAGTPLQMPVTVVGEDVVSPVLDIHDRSYRSLLSVCKARPRSETKGPQRSVGLLGSVCGLRCPHYNLRASISSPQPATAAAARRHRRTAGLRRPSTEIEEPRRLRGSGACLRLVWLGP